VTVRAVDGHGAVQPEEPEDPAPNGAQGYDQRGYHVNAA
jgi:hypothetical protein